ncbi:hypothetical protein C8J57DRAFT_1710989 [Mycena rebaudengoi]|nr:hypothetical protein C8J57DRAFT_1710989 [Mycena rebaudengoi]
MFPSLSSSATCLETLLLSSPPVAHPSASGQSSYSSRTTGRFFIYSPTPSPEVGSDIGLQSPRTLSDLSNVKVTYSDLVASSQSSDWPSTPKLGAGPRISRNKAAECPSRQQIATDMRRLLKSRRTLCGERCTEIPQLVARPRQPEPSSFTSDFFHGTPIVPIDIFSPAAGIGLGLGRPVPLPSIPRSTEEFHIIPIIDVAPGSISWSASTSPGPSNDTSALRSYEPVLLASPSPIAQLPRRFSVFDSFSTPPSETSDSQHDAFLASAKADLSNTKYNGLGHGLPSRMRSSSDGARPRMPSISESEAGDSDEEEEEEVEIVINGVRVGPSKQAQQAGLGLGLPSTLRSALGKIHQSPDSSPEQAEATRHAHNLRSAKRVLFSIPEVRSREASAEEREKRREERKNVEQQKPKPNREKAKEEPVYRRMSPAMRLASEAVRREDEKFRKKEGLDKKPTSGSKRRFKFLF